MRSLRNSARCCTKQLEGRLIAWDSGDGLHQLAKTAAAAGLGLSAQHVRTVARWMAEFQLKLAQGGVITTGEHAGGPGPGAVMELVERQPRTAFVLFSTALVRVSNHD